MASKMTTTAEEVKRIATTLPAESIEVANGEHTLVHIGAAQSQIVKRARKLNHEASAFFSKEIFMECVYDYFSDEYALQDLAQWLCDYKQDYTRKELAGCLFDKSAGMVAYPNGDIVESSDYTIIVEKKDSSYRNTRTGLPFDIVTAYLE